MFGFYGIAVILVIGALAPSQASPSLGGLTSSVSDVSDKATGPGSAVDGVGDKTDGVGDKAEGAGGAVDDACEQTGGAGGAGGGLVKGLLGLVGKLLKGLLNFLDKLITKLLKDLKKLLKAILQFVGGLIKLLLWFLKNVLNKLIPGLGTAIIKILYGLIYILFCLIQGLLNLIFGVEGTCSFCKTGLDKECGLNGNMNMKECKGLIKDGCSEYEKLKDKITGCKKTGIAKYLADKLELIYALGKKCHADDYKFTKKDVGECMQHACGITVTIAKRYGKEKGDDIYKEITSGLGDKLDSCGFDKEQLKNDMEACMEGDGIEHFAKNDSKND